MVRLKEGSVVKVVGVAGFQFQYGSIKRDLSQVLTVGNTSFQFQYGSIKSGFLILYLLVE